MSVWGALAGLLVPVAWRVEPQVVTLPELCALLSTRDQVFTCSAPLKNRVVAVALHERALDKTIEILSQALDVRFEPAGSGFNVVAAPEAKARDSALYRELTTTVNSTWSKVFRVAAPFTNNLTVPPNLEPITRALEAASGKPKASPESQLNRWWTNGLWKVDLPWEERAGLAVARGLLSSDLAEMPMSGPLFYTLRATESARLLNEDPIITGDAYWWRDNTRWPAWVNWYATAHIRSYETELKASKQSPEEQRARLDRRARSTTVTHRIHLDPLDLSVYYEYSVHAMDGTTTVEWYAADLVPGLSMPSDEKWLEMIYEGAGFAERWDRWVTGQPKSCPAKFKAGVNPKSVAFLLVALAQQSGSEVVMEVSPVRDLAAPAGPEAELAKLAPAIGQTGWKAQSVAMLGGSVEPDTAVANIPWAVYEKIDGVWVVRNVWAFLDRRYEFAGASEWLTQAKKPMTLQEAMNWAKGLSIAKVQSFGRAKPSAGMGNLPRATVILRFLAALPADLRAKIEALPPGSSLTMASAQIPPSTLQTFAADLRSASMASIPLSPNRGAARHIVFRSDLTQLLSRSTINVYRDRAGAESRYLFDALLPGLGVVDPLLSDRRPTSLVSDWIGPFVGPK
ncbi:MAG: hypothetical protein JNM85_03445 [Chthonomonas sp.]|nr:hypothetical protein [Chthonomonas sp.]